MYGMDFLREECAAWFGEKRPRSGMLKRVHAAVSQAPGKLPPHDVWLNRMVGMPDYRK